MQTLQSATEHFRRQQKISSVGLAAVRRARKSPLRAAAVLAVFQESAARDAIDSVAEMLDEQSLVAPAEARVFPTAFSGTASDGRPLASLLALAPTDAAFDLIVATQLQDAARVAAGTAIAVRPKVTGFVRMVTPPCCARCAILAGKWFRWNQGFQRHPLCDCRHIPSTESLSGDLVVNPDALWRGGQIRGITAAEQKALHEGADLAKVVNARPSYYLDDAGLKRYRTQTRPTPEQIYRDAGNDRAQAIRLLREHAYIS